MCNTCHIAIPDPSFQDALALRLARKYRCGARNLVGYAGGPFRAALAHRLRARDILQCGKFLFTTGIVTHTPTLGFCAGISNRRATRAFHLAALIVPLSHVPAVPQKRHRPFFLRD